MRTLSYLAAKRFTAVFLAVVVTCLLGTVTASAQAITFVQVNSAVPQSPQSAVSAAFSAAQSAGSLNVVVVGWNDSTSHLLTVTDSKGNSYLPAVGPTVFPGFASQTIYYAKN